MKVVPKVHVVGLVESRKNINNTEQGSLWVVTNWGSVWFQDNNNLFLDIILSPANTCTTTDTLGNMTLFKVISKSDYEERFSPEGVTFQGSEKYMWIHLLSL